MIPSLQKLLAWSCTTLGGVQQNTACDYNVIEQAGTLVTRYYHTLSHFELLAGAWDDHPPLPSLTTTLAHTAPDFFPIVKALIIRAGAHHDLVYLNADKQKLAPQLNGILDHFVSRTPEGYVATTVNALPDTATEQERTVFALAHAIFDKNNINPLGTNEYLSAIYAGLQGLKEGIAEHYILAEMMMIAGTIPFQNAAYFHLLQTRLVTALAGLSTHKHFTDQHIIALMQGAVQLANVDILSFGLADSTKFRSESFLLLQEAGHGDIGSTQRITMHQFMQSLLNRCHDHSSAIFHAIHDFPQQPLLDKLNATAYHNIRDALQDEFFLCPTEYNKKSNQA